MPHIAVSIPAAFSIFFITGALVVAILVSVSVPYIKSIYFLTATNGATFMTFGQWGVCYTGACSSKNLHYPILSYIQNNLGLANVSLSGIVENLTYALLLNPIFAGCCFVAWLFVALPACGIASKFVHVIANLWIWFTLLVGMAALGIDLGLAIKVRNAIRAAGGQASLGKGIWLMVAAVGAILIATLTTMISSCVASRKRKRSRTDRDYFEEMREPAPVSVRDSAYTEGAAQSQRGATSPTPAAYVSRQPSTYTSTGIQAAPEKPQAYRESSDLLLLPGSMHRQDTTIDDAPTHTIHHGGPDHVVSESYEPYQQQTTYAYDRSSSNYPQSQPAEYNQAYGNEKNVAQDQEAGPPLAANNHFSFHEGPGVGNRSSFAPIPYDSRGGFHNVTDEKGHTYA